MDKKRNQKKDVRSDGQEKDQTDKADEKMGQIKSSNGWKSEMDALHHTPRGEMISILTDRHQCDATHDVFEIRK